jgi:L-seryl-tRNA(Ser) seleniumtransferase
MEPNKRLASRRQFLARDSWLTALAGTATHSLFSRPKPGLRASENSSNIYQRLGVRTRINAWGTVTILTGCLTPPEVLDAMHQAAQHYVYLEELQKAVGERIAQLLGVDGAMVTSGAAGAIMLATAACVAGKDPDRIHRLPDTSGMKNQVIIQKSHRSNFDHASRNVGVRLIEVESAEELQNAINENTAMLWFLNFAAHQGQISRERFVEIGKARGVPTFIDAAADIPPASHLNEYTKMGFDLVAFSGGKGLLARNAPGSC